MGTARRDYTTTNLQFSRDGIKERIKLLSSGWGNCRCPNPDNYLHKMIN